VRLCHSKKQCARCSLGPKPEDKGTCWGCCESGPLIRIRVFNRRTGRPLHYANVIDTVCHEMAHAMTWGVDDDDHGPEWKHAYNRLLGWATSELIFDPGPDR
jgi:hypothetical protein